MTLTFKQLRTATKIAKEALELYESGTPLATELLFEFERTPDCNPQYVHFVVGFNAGRMGAIFSIHRNGVSEHIAGRTRHL